MTEKNDGKLHPVQISKEVLSLWWKNLIPLVAINAVMLGIQMALATALRVLGPVQAAQRSGEINLNVSSLYGAFVAILVVVNSFLYLVAMNFIRSGRDGKPRLAQAAKDAASRIIPYLKSFFLLWAFFLIGLFVAFAFLTGGKTLYGIMTKGAGHNFALGALLAMSTVFVVAAIAVAWYGFFFSLGPLVAAFEHVSPVASLRASRDRVRGNALRLLSVVAFLVVFYFVVGLGLYAAIMRFTRNKGILDLIDPMMFLVFGPLALVIWYVGYRRLTELRAGSREN